MQTLIVIGIVGGALLYLARRAHRAYRVARARDLGCGCDGHCR